jgi:hypothetical protein
MNNLGKYRKLSVIAMIIMALAWLLALAALWNTLLTIDVRYEGWLVFFVALTFVMGTFLFYLAYISTDASKLEKVRQDAFEAGKEEKIHESEKKKAREEQLKQDADDAQKAVEAVIAGIHGVRSLNTLCSKLLTSLAREMGFVQGIMYIKDKEQDGFYNPAGEYALTDRKPQPFKEGEGIPGQVAANNTMMILYDIPENYFMVSSGLGNSQSGFLIVVPVVHEEKCIAVLELATFKKPDEHIGEVLNKILSEVGLKINKFITA